MSIKPLAELKLEGILDKLGVNADSKISKLCSELLKKKKAGEIKQWQLEEAMYWIMKKQLAEGKTLDINWMQWLEKKEESMKGVGNG